MATVTNVTLFWHKIPLDRKENWLSYTLVRGGALVGLRLCKKCQDNYYEQDLKDRPKCQLCGKVIMDGIAVTICRLCSLETCVCMQCGTAVAADDETLEEKKRRKTRGKSKEILPDKTVDRNTSKGKDNPDDSSKGRVVGAS